MQGVTSGPAIDIPGPYASGRGYDDIITLWQKRISVSQQMRLPYENNWIKNWKLYRAYVEDTIDPADWWRSNVFIPEMFNAIETLLPRDILGMYSRPEWFGIRCPHNDWPGHPGVDCFEYERMVKSLLISTCNQIKHPSLFEETYLGRKYALIMGHAWFKLTWETEQGGRMIDSPIYDPDSGELQGMSSDVIPTVDYDNPRLRFCSNFRVWPDPTNHGEWIVEEIETTYDKLLQVQSERGIYKNLDLVQPLIGNKPTRPENQNTPYWGATGAYREAELDAVEGFSQTVRDESYDSTKVVLKQCWGRVPYEPPDGIRWRLQVIANDNVVIRDIPAPTPDLRPPYFASKSIPIPGFVYGDSVLRYAGPLNEQLNRIENFRMDEVVLGIWQQYVGNRSAIQSSQGFFEPGGILWVDTQNDVQTAFRLLDRRPVMPQAYQESAVKRDQIERTTGATAAQQGQTSADRETATSFAGRAQLGNERFRLQTMYNNMTFKQELLSRMFALLQRHMPPDRLVRIVGTDFKVPIDISMLQDNIDIDIETDVLDMDNPAKQQAFAYLLQTTLSSPEVLQRTKLDNLLRDTYESYLNHDGRKYVKSDEEMQAEAMAMAQAQMFMAAAAGGGPPHGAGGPPVIGPGGIGPAGPPQGRPLLGPAPGR